MAVTDIYQAGDDVDIQAAKACRLAGTDFRAGDWIKATLAKNWNIIDDIGSGGSWGFGGFTAQTIKKYAKEITDLQTGVIIWKR